MYWNAQHRGFFPNYKIPKFHLEIKRATVLSLLRIYYFQLERRIIVGLSYVNCIRSTEGVKPRL